MLENRTDEKYYALGPQQALEKLDSSKDGLSAEQAARRIEKIGPNKLPEAEKESIFLRFLAHFNDVLIYILIVAGVATALMGHWIDTWVILGVVVINALIGFVQEEKAEKALESIKHMLSPTALVIRSAKKEEIEAINLVPGDVVRLSSGDKVPADMRLLETHSFEVEESSLTGETQTVTKQVAAVAEKSVLADRKSMVYSGTIVRQGTALGLVSATGSATELGKINRMISEAEEITTPLIKKINNFGKWLSAAIGATAVLFFLIGYFGRGFPLGETVLMVIGIAVAAIPEGLPAILTITLAIGVQRMADRKAIVRKLPSVETLGSVTVICSDKTGTLTRNEMTAEAVYTAQQDYTVEGGGYEPRGEIKKDGSAIELAEEPLLNYLLHSNLLCNDTELSEDETGNWEIKGSPTEGALKALALKSGVKASGARRIEELPFESEYKYMAVLNEVEISGEEQGRYIFVNGAPDRLLKMATQQLGPDGPRDLDRDYWDEKIEKSAARGHRVLGSAFCRVDADKDTLSRADLKEGLLFLGLVGIMDPPRPEAIEAIAECKEAGIKVKMITGDHAATAATIGREIGISAEEKVITGEKLEEMDDTELIEAVREYDIFARTSPEHKLRLVKALQAGDEICAMTGDGVNDAPALKQADIGIAMGIKGTEVTKESAGMVLLDDNFASIVNAVEEGRTIFDNIQKTLFFLLPTNGAEALMLMIGILLGTAMVITPVQILWVNMVTAVTLALALSFEPMEKNTMKIPPRDPKQSILSRRFAGRFTFVSVLIGGLCFLIYLYLRDAGYEINLARTITVNCLVFTQMFYLFNSRKTHEPALGKDFFDNPIVFAVSAILIILQLGFTYIPFMNTLFGTTAMYPSYWSYPLTLGLLVFILVEAKKYIFREEEVL